MCARDPALNDSLSGGGRLQLVGLHRDDLADLWPWQASRCARQADGEHVASDPSDDELYKAQLWLGRGFLLDASLIVRIPDYASFHVAKRYEVYLCPKVPHQTRGVIL